MAGEAVVGALRVVLGMDTASFEDGVKSATKAASGFAGTLAAVFGGTTLSHVVERAFELIVDKIKEAVVSGIELADSMGKTAQKVGISVESLTSLGLAAQLSDVSMETLSKSLGILSKNMFEASKGTGDAKKTFEGLGISVTDGSGKLRDVGDVLSDLAGKFSTSKDGASKVTIALELLGRGGKELIPLLNQGSQSLKELGETAQRMGLVISKDAAEQAEKFNDDLKIMALAKQGIANIVTEALLPALTKLSGAFVESAKSGESVHTIANLIISAIKTLVTYAYIGAKANEILGQAFLSFQAAVIDTLDGIASPFVALGKLAITVGQSFVDGFIKPIGEAFTNLFNFLSPIFSKIASFFGKFFEGFGNLLPELSSETKDLSVNMKALNDALGDKQFQSASENWAKMKEQLAALGPEAAKVIEKVDELFKKTEEGHKHVTSTLDDVKPSKLKDELDKLSLQADVLNGKFRNLPTGFAQLAVSMDLASKSGSNLGTSLAALNPEQLKLAQGLLEMQAAQANFDAQSPFQKYQDALIQVDLLQTRVGLSAEAAAKLQVDAFTKMSDAYGNTAKSMVSGWAEAFKIMAEKNKEFATGAKALAIAEALISTYLAANKALASGPYPLNLVAVAGAVAAGLANVAKIQATQFAQGGSFKVGGAGGIDSQLISMKLTPGEMVDVRKPGVSATTPVTINLRGDSISKGGVRDLFETLNQGIRDGYRIQVA